MRMKANLESKTTDLDWDSDVSCQKNKYMEQYAYQYVLPNVT